MDCWKGLLLDGLCFLSYCCYNNHVYTLKLVIRYMGSSSSILYLDIFILVCNINNK